MAGDKRFIRPILRHQASTCLPSHMPRATLQRRRRWTVHCLSSHCLPWKDVEGMDPYSNPYTTYYGNFHLLPFLHSQVAKAGARIFFPPWLWTSKSTFMLQKCFVCLNSAHITLGSKNGPFLHKYKGAHNTKSMKGTIAVERCPQSPKNMKDP